MSTLGFFAIVLAIYYILPQKSRWGWLLWTSIEFYGSADWKMLALIGASIVGSYFAGLKIQQSENEKQKKGWMIGCIILLVAILMFFKYFGFFADAVGKMLGATSSVFKLAMPLGISYYTFKIISYLLDIYKGKIEAEKHFGYYALYVSFFPQILCGPIERADHFIPQLKYGCKFEDKMAAEGLERIIIGLFKKLAIADRLALYVGTVFEAPTAYPGLASIMAVAFYTVQIYCDFSGYSDMAIGLGRMFGFEFQENFRYPYLSKSVSEFWNRWHISLGQWFRDYVYFPLGGSRVTKGKLVRNLFVVWLLTGIWHGAAWRFILWGVGYGTIITLEKLTGFPKKNKNKTLAVLYSIFTFLTVVVGWVIFGAPGLKTALYQLGAMVGIGAEGLWDAGAVFTLSEYLPYFLGAAVFSTPVPKMGMRKLKTTRFGWLVQPLVYLGLLMLSFSFLAIGSHNPFIYFNF